MGSAGEIGVAYVRSEKRIVLITPGDRTHQIEIGEIGPLPIALASLSKDEESSSCHLLRLEERDDGAIVDALPQHDELEDSPLHFSLRHDLHLDSRGEIPYPKIDFLRVSHDRARRKLSDE